MLLFMSPLVGLSRPVVETVKSSRVEGFERRALAPIRTSAQSLPGFGSRERENRGIREDW